MTTRIVATVLALTAALLAVIAVPLGLITAGQDRADFRAEIRAAAVTLANVAEGQLSDRSIDPALARSVAAQQRAGDQVSVYASPAVLVAGAPAVPAVTAARLRGALAGEAASYRSAGWLTEIVPVRPDGSRTPVGVIAVARPTAALDHRLAVLRAWLAGVSAAGLAASALIAVALARWVSRPLAALAAAARQLGDGALDTRAQGSRGPREVRGLAAAFNAMAGRLQSLMTGHQVMLADVSHQLRTPLAALRLRLDVLAQDSDPAVAEELAGAQDEIARLARMVNGLLAVARAEHLSTPSVPVAVDTVISDRVAAWRLAASERQVTLEATSAGAATARLGDGQLEQIMDNLLANALDAVPAGGAVRVTTATAAATAGGGDTVRIIVADDGPGMSRQQLRTAFRRFASSTSGGTGLGLAIVDRLVTAGGGTAALSDTPGGGLTVTVDLPAVTRDRRRPAPASH